MSLKQTPYHLNLDIRVVQLTEGNSYRAATQVLNETFIGASRTSPVEAVKILLAQLSGEAGGWGERINVALELAVAGYSDAKQLLAPSAAEGEEEE